MQAEACYLKNAKEVTALCLLTKAQWAQATELNPYERQCLTTQGFRAELGEHVLIHDKEGKAEVVYIGAGEGNTDALALAHIASFLPPGCYKAQGLSNDAYVAWSLTQYRFDAYKINPNPLRQLLVPAEQYDEILAEANAVFLARDLINRPSNDLGPSALAHELERVAKAHDAEFKQWVGKELLDANFPAIYTVGAGAAEAPRLLSLLWGNPAHPRVTLVGKGVCFDTGGLDIKPAYNMRLMKKDMAGAAHVIALAQWLMVHRVPVRLQVLIPAVINAVSAEAFLPGDILTMRNGLTVEVHNTDAEGRLVLADALVKACEDGAELIIDFATLTGAGRVAVGTDLAALFSNNDELALQLEKAGGLTNDPIWRLPLFQAYHALFASKVADMANASDSPYAGAITAALFLQRFVKPDIAWAHFDIMAWNPTSLPAKPEGGEAMALRASAHYLRAKYA
jgi:leucyl aminopeptidase